MMNSYIDVGTARPLGVKAQDIATLVRMSLYTVNAMRIFSNQMKRLWNSTILACMADVWHHNFCRG